MDNFADILNDLILESGKSLRKIGIESGIPNSQLSRYIRTTTPKLDISMKLCKYFNCSMDYLFGLSLNKGKFIEKYNTSKFLPRYLNLLKQNNITHWKFAKKYNISESSIRQWKKGQMPKMDTLFTIAKNLDSSIDYLLGK